MSGQIASVLRFLRHAAGATEADDAALLQQFVAQRDEDAFAALLQRHGPLVLAVCRRALRERADAEDAFQATFLVLARKAGSIRKQDALAAWLHRVALNISRTIKLAAARRQAHERQVADMAQMPPPDDIELRDWQSVLHEEVDQLPEKYRLPVILCYLQGLTHEEAARHLGWPLGSIKGRLARARERLRTRLGRRGLTLTGAALTAALSEGATAAVPPALLGLTFRAALSFASGGAAVSARALALAEGALQTMTATKLLQATLLFLAVGLVGIGAGFGIGSWPQTRARAPALESREPPGRAGMAAIEPGPEVNGLRARVAPGKAKFEAGEAVPVNYAVHNVSRTEQIVWHSGFWVNHLILVRDAAGREPPLTPFGRRCRSAFSPGGERSKNVPVPIPAGGTDAAYEEYDLTKHYDLSRPGRYTVQYVYEEKHGGWEGRLPSNEATFAIVVKATADGTAAAKAARVEEAIQLTLASARPEYKAGEAVDLTLTIKNNGKDPFAHLLYKITHLFDFAMTGPDGKEVVPTPNPIEFEYASTPVTVPPGEAVTITTGLGAINLAKPPGTDRYMRAKYYPMETPGIYRLRFTLAGVTSNELKLKILGKDTAEREAAERLQDLIKEDLKRLEGTWHMVACEEGGKVLAPGNTNPNDFFTFEGTTLFFKSGHRGLEGTFTIDPSKNPKWMDQAFKTNVFKGIYELKGDTLRVYLGAPGGERPMQFKTKAGEKLWLRTFKRVKTNEDRRDAQIKEDLKSLQGAWHLAGYEEGGKVFDPKDINPNDSLTFSGTTFFFKSGMRGLRGDFTIDPSKKPKWIDERTGGDLLFKGIYELNGDTLRLFLERLENERPTEFKTREGTQQRIHTYVRVKGVKPLLKLKAVGPVKALASGDEIQLEVVLSTDGDQTCEFQLGSFPQAFGVYVQGPGGAIQTDKVLSENWMHQEHGPASSIRVSKGNPYRTVVKLSDYFPVFDAKKFKPGAYQVNVKFYDVGLKMLAPIDSGPVRFQLAPKKLVGPQAESEPVRVNDVDFQAVIDPKCAAPASGERQLLELGLRITNGGNRSLWFNVYDTLQPVLQTADGKRLTISATRLRTSLPRPVLVGPGKTETIFRSPHLQWLPDTKTLRLIGPDGASGIWRVDGLTAGKYLVHFEYEHSEQTLPRTLGHWKTLMKEGESFWVGKAVTNAVEFEIVPPAKRESSALVPVAKLISDLGSEDGGKRTAATRELFRRGKAVLPDLEKAGATQVGPTNGKPDTRRLDLVYTLLRGLPPLDLDPATRANIRRDRFTLRLEKGVTREEFLRLGRRYDFALHSETGNEFRPDAWPICDVLLWAPSRADMLIWPSGRTFEQALEEVLISEPRVVTICLNVVLQSQG
jgi:RNA polymerase sigma factor (sigma-70 family)